MPSSTTSTGLTPPHAKPLPSSPRDPLFEAIKANKESMLANMLAHGVSLRVTDQDGRTTPVMFAVQVGGW